MEVFPLLFTNVCTCKVSAKWVPRNLSVQDRGHRVESSWELLAIYIENPDNFHARLVTGDETWIHHWDPDTKQESMQWKHKDSPAPKKFRTQHSAGKVMATVFWDSRGVIMLDYKPNKTTITGAYYADIMRKLREAIKQKRRGMLTAGVLLLHDNAPVHKCRVAQAAIRDCRFEQLNHPRTVQTWPPAIIIYFVIWNRICAEPDFVMMTNWGPPQRGGFRSKLRTFITQV